MEQLCFETGLWQGRYRSFIENAGEIEKEKKAKLKARRNATLKSSLAQLAPAKTKSDSATAEIDPTEVTDSFPEAATEAAPVDDAVTTGT